MDAKAPTLPSTAAAALTAQGAIGPRWSTAITTLDWIAIAMAAAMSIATLVALSVPIVGSNGIYPLEQAWPFVAIAWAYSVYHFLENDEAARAGRLLLWSAFATLLGIVPFLIYRIAGDLGAVVAIGAALVLLAVVMRHERPARLAWLIVPASFLVTIALIAGNVPANLRLRLNEAALTAYAQSVASGATPTLAYGDAPIELGSLTFQRIDMHGGCVRFATTFVRVEESPQLGQSGTELAGLAYCPDGPPPGGGRRPASYEPMAGSWYRWVPLPAATAG